MICLSIDTIDDLILYLRSEDKHALDFKIDISMRISSMKTRSISRLSCSGLGDQTTLSNVLVVPLSHQQLFS